VYHPWRILQKLGHLTVRWTHDLPDGVLATITFDTGEIRMRPGMSQAQRRSALTHELVHHERGPVPSWCASREEAAVCREAARRLISFDELARAMVWAYDDHELAEVLWVDVPTARARLDALTRAEADRLHELIDSAELRIP